MFILELTGRKGGKNSTSCYTVWRGSPYFFDHIQLQKLHALGTLVFLYRQGGLVIGHKTKVGTLLAKKNKDDFNFGQKCPKIKPSEIFKRPKYLVQYISWK